MTNRKIVSLIIIIIIIIIFHGINIRKFFYMTLTCANKICENGRFKKHG